MEKPFETYNGGKAGNGTYQKIINHIPKCDIFIDAMVGNGGIFFNLKNRPGITVVNDIDAAVIDKYGDGGQGVKVLNLHYQNIIAQYDCISSSTFFYFDPPYLKSARKSKANLYKYEWTLADHEDFLRRAVTVKSNCMVSHYPCELYDNALAGWNTFDFMSMTRSGLAKERIYMNYDKPTVLQDYSYIGIDYIDRQRIKRKRNRFLNKLASLSDVERNALFRSITDIYDFARV